jgi:hypothetical protein
LTDLRKQFPNVEVIPEAALDLNNEFAPHKYDGHRTEVKLQ